MERQAERVFGDKLLSKEIRFDLTAGDNFRMVHEYSIPVAASRANAGKGVWRRANAVEPG